MRSCEVCTLHTAPIRIHPQTPRDLGKKAHYLSVGPMTYTIFKLCFYMWDFLYSLSYALSFLNKKDYLCLRIIKRSLHFH